MVVAKTGLAELTRATMKTLGTFTRAELLAVLPVTCRKDLERSRSVVIRDFLRSGEIKRVQTGRFEYVGRESRRTKMDVIWHLVRSHRQFGTDEIERLSGAARATVIEYLQCLKRLGYLRQPKPCHWLLVTDPGPDTPANTAKCRKLKELRRRKKDEAS